jgi:hypothetical protein
MIKQPHEVANFIKMILREMKEPVVSYDVFNKLLAIKEKKMPEI